MLTNITYKYRLYFTQAQEQLFEESTFAIDSIYNSLVVSVTPEDRIVKPSAIPTKAEVEKHVKKMMESEEYSSYINQCMPSTISLIINKVVKDFTYDIKYHYCFPTPKNEFRQVKSLYFRPILEHLKMERTPSNTVFLYFGKFKHVQMIYDRPFPKKCRCLKTVIKRENTGEYYIYFILEGHFGKNPPKGRRVTNENTVGLDFSIKNFFVASDVSFMPNISHIRASFREKKLQKTRSKAISRKEKDSKNQKKARVLYSKTEARFARRRINEFFNIAHQLFAKYDVVVVEKLRMEDMKKNRRYAKAVGEYGYKEFIKILKFVAEKLGKEVVEVSTYFPSSKICHNCGAKKRDLKVFEKEWECPKCHSINQRDYNAALNIRDEGIKILTR